MGANAATQINRGHVKSKAGFSVQLEHMLESTISTVSWNVRVSYLSSKRDDHFYMTCVLANLNMYTLCFLHYCCSHSSHRTCKIDPRYISDPFIDAIHVCQVCCQREKCIVSILLHTFISTDLCAAGIGFDTRRWLGDIHRHTPTYIVDGSGIYAHSRPWNRNLHIWSLPAHRQRCMCMLFA